MKNICLIFALLFFLILPHLPLYSDLISQAEIDFHEGRWEAALHPLTQAHLQNPLDPASLYGIAAIHESKGSPIIALLWLEALKELELDETLTDEITAMTVRLEAGIKNKISELLQLAEKSILAFPEKIEGEKRLALGSLALLYSANGDLAKAEEVRQNSVYRDASRDAFLRYYGEIRAMAHEYQAAVEVLNHMSETGEKDKLLIALASAQMARGETKEAHATIKSMSVSDSRSAQIEKAAIALIRRLDLVGAKAFIALEINQTKQRLLWDRLLEGYLKAGLLQEARDLAQQLSLQETSAIEPEEGLLTTSLLLGQAPTAPPNDVAGLYRTTLNLAWLGNLPEAKAVCRQLEPGLYQDFACAAVQAESGDTHPFFEAVRHYPPEAAGPFVESMFWRLAAIGRLSDAEQTVRLIPSPVKQAELLHELGLVAAAEGRSQDSRRLAVESYGLALQHQASSVLHRIARSSIEEEEGWFIWATLQYEKVLRWTRQAELLGREASIGHLADYLRGRKSQDLRVLAQHFLEAGGQWSNALVLIQGLRSWHGEAPW